LLNVLTENLNKNKEFLLNEAHNIYEINLDKIKTIVDNFFKEINLDFSFIDIYKYNIIDENNENFKDEIKNFSKNLTDNLEKINKLITNVKNELFIVLKNKVESINKDSELKLENFKKEISQNFSTNLNLIEEQVSIFKRISEEKINKNDNNREYENENQKLNRDIDYYIQNIAIADKEIKDLKFRNDEIENKFNELKLEKDQIEILLRENEIQFQNHFKKFDELNNKIHELNYEKDENFSYIKEMDLKLKYLENSLRISEEENIKISENINIENTKIINDMHDKKNILIEKLKSAEKSLNDTNNQLIHSENIVLNIKSENKALELKLNELENELMKKNTILDEKEYSSQNNIKKILKELENLKKELFEKNSQLENSIFNLSEKENQLESLKENNLKLASELSNEMNKNNQNYKELLIHNEHLKKKLLEYENINSNVTNHMESNNNFNCKKKKNKKKNNTLNESINFKTNINYNDEAEKIIQELNCKILEEKNQIIILNDKITEIQIKNEILLKEISKLQENLKESDEKIEIMIEEEKKYKITIEELNRFNNCLKNEKNILEKNVFEEEKISQKIKEEMNKCKIEINRLNINLSEIEILKNEKENQINYFKNNEDKLNSNIIELNLKNENLLAEKTDVINNLYKEINDFKIFNQTLVEANNALNNNNKILEKEFNLILENKNSLILEINELKRKNEEFSIEIVKLNNLHLNLINEKNVIVDELQNLKNKNLDLKLNYENIINQNTESQQINEENYLKENLILNTEQEKLKNLINECKLNVEITNSQLSEFKIKLEEKIFENNEANLKIKMLKNTIKNYKLTFKQIFLILLDDEIFIDLIQKTFNEEGQEIENVTNFEKNSEIFFEDVYNLSKLIKPKIIFSLIKANFQNLENSIHHLNLCNLFSQKIENLGKNNSEYNYFNYNDFPNNFNFQERLKKLSKENDMTINYIEKIEQFTKKSINLEELKKIDLEISGKNGIELALSEILLELEYNIDFLIYKINSKNKIISDLNSQLKTAKENLENSKKYESEKLDILNKNISKFQKESIELIKIEKTLKESLETTGLNLKEAKSDNEKLTIKFKNLQNLYEELNKEKINLIDKNIYLSQKMESFKIENLEILEKNSQREALLKFLNDKVDLLSKEKNELFNQILEFQKNRELLNEKNSLLEVKEIEIEKMRTSFYELEEFIESLKLEKERNLEISKKHISDLNYELEKYKEFSKAQEIKYNVDQNSKNEELEKHVTDLQLENKFLKEQKDQMKKYSEEILLKIKNDIKEKEFLIDKRMISNILIKYFDKNTTEKIKSALLDTLANFMGFTNEERMHIGLYVNTLNISNAINNKNDKLKELSDDLYNFILNA